jgi:RHS repeat-associated protein
MTFSYLRLTTYDFRLNSTGHEHLEMFALINMNNRMYDPVIGRMLAPDNFVQEPGFTQNYNRYSYAWNNPLVYTDPDGDAIVAAIIVGAIVGAYIGGTAGNNGELNPGNWDWNSSDTWTGIGIGAVAGGFGGYGFAVMGPAMAGALGAQFGASGTVAGYTLAGGIAGGGVGFVTGFGTGMVMSDGDWRYSAKLGGRYAAFGAGIGSTIGAAYGLANGYSPAPHHDPYENIDMTLVASTDPNAGASTANTHPGVHDLETYHYSIAYGAPTPRAYVTNYSSEVVYVKPEFSRHGYVVPVGPSQVYVRRIDGVHTLQAGVYKVPDYVRVAIDPNGGVQMYGRPLVLPMHRLLRSEMGAVDRDWLNQRHLEKDFSWDPLFNVNW